MTWTNTGTVPFYFDWPAEAVVFNEQDEIIEKISLPISLSELQPGSSLDVAVKISSDLWFKKYSIGVGIKDPMTGNASVRLGMKTIYLEGYAVLFEK